MYFSIKRNPEKYILYCNTEESRILLDKENRWNIDDDEEDDDDKEEYDTIIDNDGDESTPEEDIQEENENGKDY